MITERIIDSRRIKKKYKKNKEIKMTDMSKLTCKQTIKLSKPYIFGSISSLNKWADTTIWLLDVHLRPLPPPPPRAYVYGVIMWSPIANHKILSKIDTVETFAQPWNNTESMSRVYWCAVHILSNNVGDPDSVCVIGQGGLSHPIMCLRSRSASKKFFITVLAVASDATKTNG